MDGLVCPRLAAFVRLTQKLKAKIQKKTESSRKDLCPICGCKSNRGNLCQACFMRSFRPIAYARNIKVVEQNEFFYGPGKDRRWRRKKRADAASGSRESKDEIDEDILEMVMSSAKTFGNPLGSLGNLENSGDCNSDSEKESDEDQAHASTDPQPPTASSFDNESKTVELISSSELVKIDLAEANTHTEEENLEPLPKFVPDFWESPTEEEEDINCSMASKLKTFSVHMIKEAQRPFKEIFCDSSTNIITPSIDGKQEHEDTSNVRFSAELYQDVLQPVQQKLAKPLRNDCCQNVDTKTQSVSVSPNDQDHISFSKQLKQNATLELLKVAFKTNMILNNLFQYFKKFVDSDGSNSENSEGGQKPLLDDGNKAADCKISVDSFFFPNRQSGVLWGDNAGNKTTESRPTIADLPDRPLEEDHISETEVISKSQATLSMLMNRTEWSPFKDEAVQENGFQEEEDDFIGPCPGMQSIFMLVSESPRDRFMTRKFHSEHSKLRLKRHPDSESDVKLSESWASSDMGFQPSSIIVANGTAAGDQGTSSGNPGVVQEPSSATESGQSHQSGKSLLDLVFGLNRTCVKPSLLPLPDCQQDLITLSSPEPSKDNILEPKTRKDADSQTALSSRHLEQEMNLLHKAFLDQLAHFSVQLIESCKAFGHSWQTSFLAELVEHFRTACSIISSIVGETSCQAMPSSDSLDELQDVSNRISVCLAKLRAHPHSFVGDCSDHDISTLLSSSPDQAEHGLVNTWV